MAAALAARGRNLSAGDIVPTGMTTGTHAVVPGSPGRAPPLGKLSGWTSPFG